MISVYIQLNEQVRVTIQSKGSNWKSELVVALALCNTKKFSSNQTKWNQHLRASLTDKVEFENFLFGNWV